MLVARDEGDAQFNDEEIFGNVITMLLAGEDTTANTIAWIMRFMTEYPEVQNKMQAEVDAVLGTAEGLDDFDDARKLGYLEAVAHETMRLKPVAPIIGLETNVDVQVHGVHIPTETSIMLLTRPGVLQESNFAEADAFRPGRWLSESKIHSVRRHPSFMPFGSGPRLCPGRSLALLKMKTAMAMVCRNFDVLGAAQQAGQVGETFAFTMMPTNLFVNFSRRVPH